MARTSFADPRENCARPGALSALSRRLIFNFRDATSEDRLRTAMIASAATFACVAIAALHLPGEVVASVLLATAAALVALASTCHQPSSWSKDTAIGSTRPTATDAAPLQSQLYTLLSKSRQQSQKPSTEWLDFTARMSHDLRTPLNAVIGFSELMASDSFGPIDPETCRAYARHIHASGRALLKSAEDSLAITALLAAPHGELKPSCVRLIDEIQSVWNTLAAAAVLETSSGAPPSSVPRLHLHSLENYAVSLDAQTFRRIMLNLLTEAAARSARSAVPIEISVVASNGQLKLTIAVDDATPRSALRPESISLCVARTLLALSHITLTEKAVPGGRWCLSFYLDCATQPDFFSSPAPHF